MQAPSVPATFRVQVLVMHITALASMTGKLIFSFASMW